MQVTCRSCGEGNEFPDPSDEGWQYELRDVDARFTDAGVRVVTRREGTRRLFWRCVATRPTDDAPNALCLTDNVVVEDWSTSEGDGE